MTEPIIGKGCMKCSAHDRCVDAFQAHSYKCNNYDKTDIEFKDWLLTVWLKEKNNEDHD